MSEAKLSKYVRKVLQPYGHVEKHEDKHKTGIPDLSYGINGVNGWIELKFAKEWPKKPETPVRFKHFTAKQRNWLKERGKTGRHCWVLIQVADCYMLFYSSQVDLIGTLTREEMIKYCYGFWFGGGVKPNKLIELLTI